ncbi:MAG TPA: aldo/keto reductase [Gaiellales bacterium]|jgi:diketogulonate reductase-like aldo/keto reductase|nr:aldo/keto reductase [Gaiellales bacterium]
MTALENPTVTIAPGVDMPLVGIGTWRATGREAHGAVLYALEIGYRHIDTATMYGNEREVGQALRESGVPRDEVFITTKLPSGNAGRERETIEASLAALGVEHLDLWLIHWPPGGQARPSTWKAFVEARADGLTRAIGVSNYDERQIDELIDATGVSPAVNQIMWSPALYDPEVVEALRRRGVTLEGYSPFESMNMNDPVLREIAERHGVTPYQVVVRWHIEHGFVVIPKSSHRERIAANFDVFGFALDASEVARIDSLGR